MEWTWPSNAMARKVRKNQYRDFGFFACSTSAMVFFQNDLYELLVKQTTK